MCFILLQLAIKAQDLGSPPLSSEKTITVSLENIDDNVPVFNEVQASNTDWVFLFLFLFLLNKCFRDLYFRIFARRHLCIFACDTENRDR